MLDKPCQAQSAFLGRLGCSIDAAGRALGLKRDAIYDLLASGKLVTSRIGRGRVVHIDSLHRLLAATVVPPKRP